jgi:hypothetical protein
MRIVRRVAVEKCWTYSPSGAMYCTLPPDHVQAGWDFHAGLDKLGRMRTWKRRPRWVVDCDEAG